MTDLEAVQALSAKTSISYDVQPANTDAQRAIGAATVLIVPPAGQPHPSPVACDVQLLFDVSGSLLAVWSG